MEMSQSQPRVQSESVRLRTVQEGDLARFFEQQKDPLALRMAAFTAEDPADERAFRARWARILADPAVVTRTVLCEGEVAGSVLSFLRDAQREVGYWLGREYWGRGIATRALGAFLAELPTRPLFARAAKDNRASLRVLEKCGFAVLLEARAFANARGEEIPELVLALGAGAP